MFEVSTATEELNSPTHPAIDDDLFRKVGQPQTHDLPRLSRNDEKCDSSTPAGPAENGPRRSGGEDASSQGDGRQVPGGHGNELPTSNGEV